MLAFRLTGRDHPSGAKDSPPAIEAVMQFTYCARVLSDSLTLIKTNADPAEGADGSSPA
ncbi:MAG: hypothetical protein OEM51_10800 [Gammaproteobacteria bacterium]|nr:hypothetical protein [Gammaproteobacteria bacterium]